MDTLNSLQSTMETCLIGITNSYYNLLLNYCLPDFELYSDGKIAIPNFKYNHLESFFLEPERLSLIDQLELRQDVVVSKPIAAKVGQENFFV